MGASVLGSCLQPAPAQTPGTIVLTPPSPAVGGGVSLAPQPAPQDFVVCSWFRSDNTDENSRILTYFPGPPPVQTNGPAHTGRETAGPGCALHIAGLRLSDTGSYTVQILSPTSPVLGTVHLPVSEMLPRPPVPPNPTLRTGPSPSHVTAPPAPTPCSASGTGLTLYPVRGWGCPRRAGPSRCQMLPGPTPAPTGARSGITSAPTSASPATSPCP
ncbi:unnamed protein product, partial [Natator depressus]